MRFHVLWISGSLRGFKIKTTGLSLGFGLGFNLYDWGFARGFRDLGRSTYGPWSRSLHIQPSSL